MYLYLLTTLSISNKQKYTKALKSGRIAEHVWQYYYGTPHYIARASEHWEWALFIKVTFSFFLTRKKLNLLRNEAFILGPVVIDTNCAPCNFTGAIIFGTEPLLLWWLFFPEKLRVDVYEEINKSVGNLLIPKFTSTVTAARSALSASSSSSSSAPPLSAFYLNRASTCTRGPRVVNRVYSEIIRFFSALFLPFLAVTVVVRSKRIHIV